MSDNPFIKECWSCGIELTSYRAKRVPSGIDCCFRCWSKIPIAERLKIVIAVRDREPGGIVSEITEIVIRSIEHQQKER